MEPSQSKHPHGPQHAAAASVTVSMAGSDAAVQLLDKLFAAPASTGLYQLVLGFADGRMVNQTTSQQCQQHGQQYHEHMDVDPQEYTTQASPSTSSSNAKREFDKFPLAIVRNGPDDCLMS